MTVKSFSRFDRLGYIKSVRKKVESVCNDILAYLLDMNMQNRKM